MYVQAFFLAFLASTLLTQTAVADDSLNRACDMLASSPLDVDRPSDIPGVAFDAVDPKAAIPACKAAHAADASNRRINFQYGRALDIGGEAEDIKLALSLYEMAANAGNVTAIHNLANLHYNGRGTEVDLAKAVELYQQAAKADFTLSMVSLGFAYLEGKGTVQNQNLGHEWILKAADKGNVLANREAGLDLATGRGTAVDLARSIYYSKRAAELGNPQAMNDLSLVLLEGPAEFRDLDGGRKWILKAADMGSGMAMMNIATFTFSGSSFPKNEPAGIDWLVKALRVNDEIPTFLIAERARNSTDPKQDLIIEEMLKWKGLMTTAPDGKFDDETVAALTKLKDGP